jgi:hypothetical protein
MSKPSWGREYSADFTVCSECGGFRPDKQLVDGKCQDPLVCSMLKRAVKHLRKDYPVGSPVPSMEESGASGSDGPEGTKSPKRGKLRS